MATNNRASLINKVVKVSKKYFKPSGPPELPTVLEHLVYACCVENTLPEEATKVQAVLTSEYFDWNEVRVTSIRELAEVMKSLNDPNESATRLKRVLQSVFETHYSFDLEGLRKQNIGQAIKQLQKYNGTTSFTVAYVTQHALSGHSIPVNDGLLQVMHIVGVVSDAEASKGTVPGLERAVPKSKGAEIGSLLHQLGVEYHRSPYGPTIRKYLLEIDPDCKDRLPKRAAKKPEKRPEPATANTEQVGKSDAKQKTPADASTTSAAPRKKKVAKKSAASTVGSKSKTASKTSTAKKAPATKKVVKKKKVKTSTNTKKKSLTKKLKKRKPR